MYAKYIAIYTSLIIGNYVLRIIKWLQVSYTHGLLRNMWLDVCGLFY